MQAVIYARYSSERQTEQSIEGQLRECYEFAKAEGITIIGEYIDRAISGTTDHRPDFQRMIADSKSGDFSAVIVYKLDRFARNRYDSAIYKAKLKANGVKVLSAKERITDSPEGIILEGLLEAMNEYYSADLSQKIKRGMRENVLKGKTTGGNVALGYRIGADKRLEIDETGAALVRHIFAEYDSGKTFAEISNTLNAAGHLTSRGKPFKGSTLSRILANRKYIGEYQVEGITERSECPAIVDKALFERVQKRLQEHLQKYRHRSPHHTYLLTGLLTCSQCGKSMSGTSGTSKTGDRYYYYVCPEKCHGRIPAEPLEQTITDTLTQFLTEQNCKEIAQKAYELYEAERQSNPELAAAKKELQATEKQLQNAVNAVLSGFSSETLKGIMQDLERRKATLEREMHRLSHQMPKFEQAHFTYFMQQFRQFQHSEGDRRKLLETLVNRVVLYPEQIAILINLTDQTKTPPLKQLTAALGRCSCCVACGGGIAPQPELSYLYLTPNIIALFLSRC